MTLDDVRSAVTAAAAVQIGGATALCADRVDTLARRIADATVAELERRADREEHDADR